MSTETPSSNTKQTEKKKDKGAPPSERRLVQMNLRSTPAVGKSPIAEKSPQMKQRTCTDTRTPSGAPDISNDLCKIQQRLQEIQQTMVNKNDVKEIVVAIINKVKSEMKQELKQEILTEVRQTLNSEVSDKLEERFDQKLDKKCKDFERQVKDSADGLNLELETMREKIVGQNQELRQMKEALKHCQTTSGEALQLANQNQQYSQKNNIKFWGWKEAKDEDLRSDLCDILKQKVNVDLDPKDVLAIHSYPQAA